FINLLRVDLAFQLAVQGSLDLFGIFGGYLADRRSGASKSLLEVRLHLVLDRPPRKETVNLDDFVLSESINAADALFNPHGVPREVIVDADMAELQVDSLPSRLG